MLTLVALCSVLAAEGFVADVAAPRAPRASAALRAASAEAADVAPSLSARVSAIEPSKTIAVHALTQDMRARGEEVVSLCVGEPDFPPPAAALDALRGALDAGETRYTGVSGTLALRDAVVADLARRKGVYYAPDEVLVSNGAKQSVYQAVLATVGPGDEVIVPAPYWPSYPEIVRLAGATPVVVGASAADGYALTPEGLAAALTPRTRLLILCNPSNPSGCVLGAAALDALADVLRSHEHGARVWVLADEIYERLCYADGAPGAGDAPAPDAAADAAALAAAAAAHVSFAALDGMRERTLVVNGFSKAYAMTGLRLGYVAAPRAAVKACTAVQSQLTSCASSVAQAAGVAALELAARPDDDAAYLGAALRALGAKRDRVLRALAATPPLAPPPVVPAGAFYVLADVSATFGATLAPRDGGDGARVVVADANDFCVELLARHRVALVPGEAFGAPDAVRLSYATSVEEIDAAMSRIAAFVAELRDGMPGAS